MGLKTSGGWVSFPYQVYIDDFPVGSPVLVASGTGYKAIDFIQTTGYNTPNFHQRLRRGELLPFTVFEQYAHSGQGNNHYDLQTSTWPASGTREFSQVSNVVQAWYSDDIVALRGILASNSAEPYLQAAAQKAASGSFDALTFLAELHKTLAMFANLGSKFLNVIKAKPPGKPWDLWLEGRYGWRTLLFDLKDFSQALGELSQKRSRRKERSGATQRWTTITTSTESDSKRTILNTWNKTYELGVRGSIIADIEPNRFQFNPIVTAWELIPFSFVVDWFITVGTTLASLTLLLMDVEYVAGTGKSIKVTTSFTRQYTAKAGQVFTDGAGLVDSKASLVQRSPSPVTYIPQFRLKIDDFKIADLVSLIIQAVFRR